MNEKTIFNTLTKDPVLLPIIGKRVQPNNLDKNLRKPAITYFKYGRNKRRLYKGGESKELYQVNIYSNTYEQAKKIESRIISLFDGVESAENNTFSKVTDVKDFYDKDLNNIVVELEITKY